MSAMPAVSDQKALPGFGEVVKKFIGCLVVNNRAQGNGDLQILAAFPALGASESMLSTVCFEGMVVTELEQRVLLRVGDKIDIAAVAAIAAARAALRDELLPSKGDAAVPAVSGAHRDFGFVNEHGEKDEGNLGSGLIRGRAPNS